MWKMSYLYKNKVVKLWKSHNFNESKVIHFTMWKSSILQNKSHIIWEKKIFYRDKT